MMDTNGPLSKDHVEHLLDERPKCSLEMSRGEQRVSIAIYRLLARGRPASTADIAQAAEVSENSVREALSRWCGVYYDDEGRVISYWGIALPKTEHRFEVEGRTVYTWCAWDALFIPELIQKTARVVSKSPAAGEEVHLTVSPEGAESTGGPGIHVSFPEPDAEKCSEEVPQAFCRYVFFFTSVAVGRQWTEKHPGTYLLTLEQAFALGKWNNMRQYGDVLAKRQQEGKTG